jgi:polysaccharide export outer membrane protein
MNLCFYPPQQLQSRRVWLSILPNWLGRVFAFGIVYVTTLLFIGVPSFALGSQFPDYPPVAPATTGTYAAKLPAYSMVSSAVPTKPADTNTVTDPYTDILGTNAVANTSTNPMDVLDNEYKLAPGDTIDFQVLEDKVDPNENNDAKPIVVADSGDVEIPYIGRYPAAGKTCLELAGQLKGELEKKYYYQATVIVSVKSMTSKGVIYVMGVVRSPGPLEMPRDEVLTVSKAILRAGGFDDFADRKHVQVTRKESGTNAVFTVNVSAVLDRSKNGEDRDAQPGDFIYVPERTFRY